MNSETEQIFLLNPTASNSLTILQKADAFSETTQVNLENVEDFSNVCRTCATITEFVIPIFEGEGLQNNLADKIHKHLPIQVTEQDMLPRVVCYQCASTLLAWHELVQCCVQADTALRTRLAELESKPPAKCDTEDSLDKDQQIKSEMPLQFYSILQKVLLAYFHIQNVNEDTVNFDFVCQKCDKQQYYTSIEQLAGHLEAAHHSDIQDEATMAEFVKNFVTFEETLIADDELHTEVDIKPEPDEPQSKPNVALCKLPNYCCPFCEKIFSSSTRLVCHLNRHVEVSIVKGVVCCKTLYNRKTSFVEHLQQAHVKRFVDSAGSVCRSCGHTAADAEDLKAHVGLAHSDKTNIKTTTGKERSAKNQKHIPAVCPECNKTFANKYSMLVHMRGHAAAQEYACDVCHKRYRHQSSLITHRSVVHEGRLRFACPQCGEEFPTRAVRDVHARLHSGATPFACRYCDKAFRAVGTLARHLEMHFDVRRHRCPHCDKRFRRSTHLDYHVRIHQRKA